MRRRPLLASVAVALSSAVAGCLDEADDGGSETERETETTSGTATNADRTTASPSDIEIVFVNLTSGDEPITVAATIDGRTIFNGEITPDETLSADSEITSTGGYELEVVVEGGPSTSQSFSVSEYDLRQGSNLIVHVHDDELTVLIEE